VVAQVEALFERDVLAVERGVVGLVDCEDRVVRAGPRDAAGGVPVRREVDGLCVRIESVDLAVF